MIELAKQQVKETVMNALGRLVAEGKIEAVPLPAFNVERPADVSHGDFSCNAAMASAKALRNNPRAIGQMIADAAVLDGTVFEKIFGPRKYYFISLVIIIYSLLPFFMVFEGRKPQVRELVVLATMVALATAGRAAFFMIPSFKPIIAIVIISAIAFGGEAGFLVGAMTMVVSNFLFGQGPWTPWQMFAMGFIGFLSGILYRIGLLPTKRLSLCIYGFLVTVFIYGGIMNPAALFMSVYDFTWEGLLAIYISGIPVDLVHASSTFIFLWIGAKPLLEKLQRIKIKYDLMR